jgi:hypothetical protein
VRSWPSWLSSSPPAPPPAYRGQTRPPTPRRLRPQETLQVHGTLLLRLMRKQQLLLAQRVCSLQRSYYVTMCTLLLQVRQLQLTSTRHLCYATTNTRPLTISVRLCEHPTRHLHTHAHAHHSRSERSRLQLVGDRQTSHHYLILFLTGCKSRAPFSPFNNSRAPFSVCMPSKSTSNAIKVFNEAGDRPMCEKE